MLNLFRINQNTPKESKLYFRFFLDVSGVLHSETGEHFIGNNISYRRSYLPEHYWIGKAILNTRQNMIEVERVSLRGKILFHGDYAVVESKHVLNTIIVEGTAGTDISGTFEVDLQAKETHATINLTSGNIYFTSKAI